MANLEIVRDRAVLVHDSTNQIIQQETGSVHIDSPVQELDLILSVPKVTLAPVSITQQGPPGPIGNDATYIHNQMTPSSEWVINHPLNKYPSVTIVDSAGTVHVADVSYDSASQITIQMNASFAGKAYLN